MKKIIFINILVWIILFFAFYYTRIYSSVNNEVIEEGKEEVKKEVKEVEEVDLPVEIEVSQFVSYNGKLHVDGTSLKNNKNQNFSLKGISSHNLLSYSSLLTYDNFKTLKDTWGINCFRLAMYTNENGYISNEYETKKTLVEIADSLISLDMYVILDWHTLTDNDPNIYKTEAVAFFDEISKHYKDCPNIIFEICNEPNGNNVTWDGQIKPYAEEVISVIRKNSPDSLIIVGTPDWCKNLSSAAKNPLNFKNILYSCHFYAGTHKNNLRTEIDNALNMGLPVIISEWGTTDASGNGENYFDESKTWIDFLDSRNISFINWSFSNKDEKSAILRSDFISDSTYLDLNDYLTESGRFVKSIINF